MGKIGLHMKGGQVLIRLPGRGERKVLVYKVADNGNYCEQVEKREWRVMFRTPTKINIVILTKRTKWRLTSINGYELNKQGEHKDNLECMQQIQREILAYTETRHVKRMKLIELEDETNNDTIRIQVTMRKDEVVRIAYRAEPFGTMVTLNEQNKNTVLKRFPQRGKGEYLIVLYNRISSEPYEDQTETNFRFEVYEIQRTRLLTLHPRD